MSTSITNKFSSGKFGALIATPETSYAAPRRRKSLKGLFKAWKAWRALRAAENELANLSDRDLADIGIVRCEIRRVVRSGR
jgi:uncharacterized protein YjiS (DUF1127 family)